MFVPPPIFSLPSSLSSADPSLLLTSSLPPSTSLTLRSFPRRPARLPSARSRRPIRGTIGQLLHQLPRFKSQLAVPSEAIFSPLEVGPFPLANSPPSFPSPSPFSLPFPSPGDPKGKHINGSPGRPRGTRRWRGASRSSGWLASADSLTLPITLPIVYSLIHCFIRLFTDLMMYSLNHSPTSVVHFSLLIYSLTHSLVPPVIRPLTSLVTYFTPSLTASFSYSFTDWLKYSFSE